MYSIGEFAKLINKNVKTIQLWDRLGKLIAKRTPTNRRYYTEQDYLEYKGLISKNISKIIAYVRVSSKNQKDDLKNQKEYILEYSKNAGIFIDEIYEDFGSGLNFNRKNFNKLMCEVEKGLVKLIVISYKDRLVRFGFDWFYTFCQNHGCEIKLINDEKTSPEIEMINDLISIIHVFSCRIYGLRKYKEQIKNDKII